MRAPFRLAASALVTGGFYAFPLLLALGLAPAVELAPAPVPAEDRVATFALALPGPDDDGGTDQAPPDEDEAAEAADEAVPAGPRVRGSPHRARAERTAAARATRAARARGREGRGRRCRKDVEGVDRVADGRWRVERALVERYVRDLRAARRLASVAWARDRDGDVVGVRLRRVPCGSPLREAGLRPGDVVIAVNGKRITSIGRALKAVRKVRRSEQVRVRVRRRGKVVVLRYLIA